MLNKFGMEDCKPVGTPMVTRCKVSINDESKSTHQTNYRSMIRGLQYLTHTRLDIVNAVGIVARFQSNPKETHLAPVKRIFRYLKGTMEYGLWYDRSNVFTLQVYIDIDWVGDTDDRKSTSGGAFFLGERLVSWLSKKQNNVSLSTAESEYVAAAINCTQVLWMKQMLKDFGITFEEPVVIHYDNTSTINMSKNPIMHSKTKHISIKYHMIREKVAEKEVKLEYISTKEQIVDIFTKPLPKETFEYLKDFLGVKTPPYAN
jgi:hypothetical protein